MLHRRIFNPGFSVPETGSALPPQLSWRMRATPMRPCADSRVRLSPALVVYSWQLLFVGSGVKGKASAVIVDAAAHNKIRA